MRIVVAGGGSGGHLTPLIAVAQAVKDIDRSAEVVYIGQKGERLQHVLEHPAIDGTHSISAGKFRRYHGESFLQHLSDMKTIALNIRDFFRFVAGIFQAWFLLGRVKPDAIFLKGGFVCVPVGFAARVRGIPYITHDSDAIPGLANRLTAKHAIYNTVAMPEDNYPYPKQKTVQVGIPLQSEFKKVSEEAKKSAKRSLGIEDYAPVLFVVGGGLGAQKINLAIAEAAPVLLRSLPDMRIIHIAGQKLFSETHDRYREVFDGTMPAAVRLLDFSTELYVLSEASDVVVTRAGATNMAEFAAQAKACVVVPNPVLTGGQQLHNADVIAKNEAAVIVNEDDLASLPARILELFEDDVQRKKLGGNLHTLFIDGASQHLADMLVDIAKATMKKAR